MKIANKIGTLQKETIDDTLTLLDHDSLQQALTLIKNCSPIYLFGTSNCRSRVFICYETFRHAS